MTEAIEVIARLGDTILDVCYVTDGRYAIGGHHFEITKLCHATSIRIGLVELSLQRGDRPRRAALAPTFDHRLLSYFAGSLAAHLAVWLISLDPIQAIGAPVSPEDRGVVELVALLDPPSPNREAGDSPDDATHQLAGHIQVADQHDQPKLSREEAIAQARLRGVLGSTALTPDAFKSIVGISGELDKAIIRRYIKREMPKIQYCYEKELLSDATISGTLTAQFLIATDGTVQSVHTEGVAEPINQCVAGVIKNIKFPHSIRESTQVNYPFIFRWAGR